MTCLVRPEVCTDGVHTELLAGTPSKGHMRRLYSRVWLTLPILESDKAGGRTGTRNRRLKQIHKSTPFTFELLVHTGTVVDEKASYMYFRAGAKRKRD